MNPSSHEDGSPPSKMRRIARACLQCRSRKQRCTAPSLEEDDSQAPCNRCRQLGVTCSFESEPLHRPDDIPAPSRVALLVMEHHKQLEKYERRLSALERNRLETSADSVQQAQLTPGVNIEVPPPPSGPIISPDFNLRDMEFSTPIATLRNLGATAGSSSRVLTSNVQAIVESFDPVSRGIISLVDAQRTIEIFFQHCHALAPLLSPQTALRSSPVLFLAVCSIGARFWDDKPSNSSTLHPSYGRLIELLDAAISRLLVRPSPSDVTLDSIRVLLLYTQWMPCDFSNGNSKSRYNDISAWAVLGLAHRYALVLGLDNIATAPIKEKPSDQISEEDLSRIRVLNNLITCDYNLMLSSGLPASIDPAPAASVAEAFASHSFAHQPEDLRISALIELVVVVHNAMQDSDKQQGRQLDSRSLKKANSDFDVWERRWQARLKHTDSQHIQLPFSSLRWYRLALNGASLGPVLSSHAQSLQIWRLQSLEISVTSACQILVSLSNHGTQAWTLESQMMETLPSGRLTADPAAIRRLSYGVDSTWISHTFAVVFLVFCYVKGIIDENLQISNMLPARGNPVYPSLASMIAKMVQLSLDIFDGVCSTPTFHPARGFQTIVHNAASLILLSTDSAHNQELDASTMQSLLGIMSDSGLEWPGNIFDDLGPNWLES